MTKDFDHEYTDEIVCPHCGHEFKDSWDYGYGHGVTECGSCDKEFNYQTNETVVTYSTWVKGEKV